MNNNDDDDFSSPQSNTNNAIYFTQVPSSQSNFSPLENNNNNFSASTSGGGGFGMMFNNPQFLAQLSTQQRERLEKEFGKTKHQSNAKSTKRLQQQQNEANKKNNGKNHQNEENNNKTVLPTTLEGCLQQILQTELICKLCRMTLCDPVVTACNHVFCKPCVARRLNSKRSPRLILQEFFQKVRTRAQMLLFSPDETEIEDVLLNFNCEKYFESSLKEQQNGASPSKKISKQKTAIKICEKVKSEITKIDHFVHEIKETVSGWMNAHQQQENSSSQQELSLTFFNPPNALLDHYFGYVTQFVTEEGETENHNRRRQRRQQEQNNNSSTSSFTSNDVFNSDGNLIHTRMEEKEPQSTQKIEPDFNLTQKIEQENTSNLNSVNEVRILEEKLKKQKKKEEENPSTSAVAAATTATSASSGSYIGSIYNTIADFTVASSKYFIKDDQHASELQQQQLQDGFASLATQVRKSTATEVDDYGNEVDANAPKSAAAYLLEQPKHLVNAVTSVATSTARFFTSWGGSATSTATAPQNSATSVVPASQPSSFTSFFSFGGGGGATTATTATATETQDNNNNNIISRTYSQPDWLPFDAPGKMAWSGGFFAEIFIPVNCDEHYHATAATGIDAHDDDNEEENGNKSRFNNNNNKKQKWVPALAFIVDKHGREHENGAGNNNDDEEQPQDAPASSDTSSPTAKGNYQHLSKREGVLAAILTHEDIQFVEVPTTGREKKHHQIDEEDENESEEV